MGLWMSKAFGNVLYLLGGEVRSGICIEQFGVWSREVRFVSFGTGDYWLRVVRLGPARLRLSWDSPCRIAEIKLLVLDVARGFGFVWLLVKSWLKGDCW
ncbi:hypothetical protein Droror1_Dr00018876 [Drosera rotundifolia]